MYGQKDFCQVKVKRHQAKAFSLIELMVTIAIVGVLAMVAIPSYKSYIKRAQVVSAVQLMQNNTDNINQYILAHNKVPPSGSFTMNGTSSFGHLAWEGTYGIAFYFDDDFNPPDGWLQIIYLRPHHATDDTKITWKCSLKDYSTGNPFQEFLPSACQQDDDADFPEG